MTGPTTTTPETTTELTPAETPAQRVERIKREKPSWSIMDDIRRYSREGFSAITIEDLTVRFRAWGLHPGRRTRHRGDEMPFFMMRVRTPNGFLTSDMTVASRTSRTRTRAAASTSPARTSSCTGCASRTSRRSGSRSPKSGGRAWAPAATIRARYRLPAGRRGARRADRREPDRDRRRQAPQRQSRLRQPAAQVQDHDHRLPALVLVSGDQRHRRDGGASGRRRGGLPRARRRRTVEKPHLAVLLPAFVHPEQVPLVVETITAIFRDSDELRVNRAKARMKFCSSARLDAESFLAEIERRIGFKLDAPARSAAEDTTRSSRIQPQKQRVSATPATRSSRGASRPISCAVSRRSPTSSATDRCASASCRTS